MAGVIEKGGKGFAGVTRVFAAALQPVGRNFKCGASRCGFLPQFPAFPCLFQLLLHWRVFFDQFCFHNVHLPVPCPEVLKIEMKRKRDKSVSTAVADFAGSRRVGGNCCTGSNSHKRKRETHPLRPMCNHEEMTQSFLRWRSDAGMSDDRGWGGRSFLG